MPLNVTVPILTRLGEPLTGGKVGQMPIVIPTRLNMSATVTHFRNQGLPRLRSHV